MTRLVLVLFLLAMTASAVVAYKDPERIARYSDTVSDLLRKRSEMPSRSVQIPRGQSGEFAVQARINGVPAAMVIDTGATSVVLTYETAKAAGLPQKSQASSDHEKSSNAKCQQNGNGKSRPCGPRTL